MKLVALAHKAGAILLLALFIAAMVCLFFSGCTIGAQSLRPPH
jgi:hypothetical protein